MAKWELTTDAHMSYPAAVEEAFSGHVDYGTTEMEGVANSFVERQNLTMRMHAGHGGRAYGHAA